MGAGILVTKLVSAALLDVVEFKLKVTRGVAVVDLPGFFRRRIAISPDPDCGSCDGERNVQPQQNASKSWIPILAIQTHVCGFARINPVNRFEVKGNARAARDRRCHIKRMDGQVWTVAVRD